MKHNVGISPFEKIADDPRRDVNIKCQGVILSMTMARRLDAFMGLDAFMEQA
jgi:hypothetical protein